MSGTTPTASSGSAPQGRPLGQQGSGPSSSRERYRRLRWTLITAGAVAAAIWGITAAQDAAAPPTASAGVGPDLHTLAVVGEALYIGGHSAVAQSLDSGKTWSRLSSLDNADAMGWAVTDNAVLFGGAAGLYRSTREAVDFTRITEGVPADGVRALGGAGSTVYLASPSAGLLVSHDAGQTWQTRNSEAGSTFLGTIQVDASNPERIIVPDTKSGLRLSTDGGKTFTSLGGPANARYATRNPADPDKLVAVGADGAAKSKDAGSTWQDIDVPPGTSKVQYAADGRTLYAATAIDNQPARLYRSGDDGANWQPTA